MTARLTRPRSLVIAVASFLIVSAVAFSAAQFRPGTWYQGLAKPPWTPPDWLFAPVWTLLYAAIAVAGWLIFTRPVGSPARVLWVAQLVLNGLWSWLFFGLHLTGVALADIALLLAAIIALLVWLAPRQRLAFWLLLPYAVWVGYALTLNAGIVVMNP